MADDNIPCVNQTSEIFPSRLSSTGNGDLQHYQLYGSTSVRIAQNALKIKDSILHHCGVNVFTTKTELKTIASATVIPESAKKDIIEFASKGQE